MGTKHLKGEKLAKAYEDKAMASWSRYIASGSESIKSKSISMFYHWKTLAEEAREQK
jgi:hypothetical protein